MNVRLSDEDVAKVEELRRQGIEFSSIVREALQTKYAERVSVRKRPDPATFFAELDKKYPLPKNLPPRGYDVHDRHQFAAAFAAHIRRKRTPRNAKS